MARPYYSKSLNAGSGGNAGKNNKYSILILHQNICSLRHKISELELHLNTELNQVKVMCLTEHWLNCQNLNNTNIKNFKLVSAFSRKNKTHGGSCIYVKNNIVTKDVGSFMTLGEEINFELSITELIDIKLYVGCIYRAPNGQFDIFLDKLELIIQKLMRTNKTFVLCGDWNVDMLQESSNKKELVGLLQRYNLINTIESPTRITKNSSTLIDLTVINKNRYKSPASIHELGLSDHLAQTLMIPSTKPMLTPIKLRRRNFSKNNIDKFIKLLEQEQWLDVTLKTEVNPKFNLFINKLTFLFNKAFPLRKITLRNPYHVTWITPGIKKSSNRIRLFNLLKKRFTISVSTKHYIDNYKQIYKRVLNEAKRREYDKLLLKATNTSKAAWKIIKNETGKAANSMRDISLDLQSNEINDVHKLAEVFNTFFCETPKILLMNNKIKNNTHPNKPQMIIKGCNKSFFFSPVDEHEIVKLAKSLKNKFTSGCDDIHDAVVKQCIEVLKKPLTDIFNASLESGTFPEQLKIAKITPIHKKGNTRNINNYRPIASLSVFSKLLEKVVYNRITTFLEQHEIITEAQHGFRSKRSTETALFDFINKVQLAIENKMNPVSIFLDLSKAYDVLDHELLLYKLKTYGIRGITNKWMKSYLSNRKQCVEVKSHTRGKAMSSTREVNIGVPQGSILGPLLFLLFVNDLPLNVPNAKTILYADDTNFIMTGRNLNTLQDNVNNTILSIQTWFSTNNLVINRDKTSSMCFNNYQNKNPIEPHIILHGKMLPSCATTQFLGIQINANLKWNYHIDSVKSKLNNGYYIIKQLQKITSPQILRMIYFACIHAHLKYGIIMWGGDPNCKRVFVQQKKIIRTIYKANQHTSCRNLFRTLGILPLPCVYICEMVCWIKRHRNKLDLNLNLHDHNTRHKADLHPLTCRTNLIKNNGLNMGIRLFNKLPEQLKNLETNHTFKNNVKKYLLHNVFYSVNEFLSV